MFCRLCTHVGEGAGHPHPSHSSFQGKWCPRRLQWEQPEAQPEEKLQSHPPCCAHSKENGLRVNGWIGYTDGILGLTELTGCSLPSSFRNGGRSGPWASYSPPPVGRVADWDPGRWSWVAGLHPAPPALPVEELRGRCVWRGSGSVGN